MAPGLRERPGSCCDRPQPARCGLFGSPAEVTTSRSRQSWNGIRLPCALCSNKDPGNQAVPISRLFNRFVPSACQWSCPMSVPRTTGRCFARCTLRPAGAQSAPTNLLERKMPDGAGADQYAGGVYGAAARKVNKIPAASGIPSFRLTEL
jgi:hypothetical protein